MTEKIKIQCPYCKKLIDHFIFHENSKQYFVKKSDGIDTVPGEGKAYHVCPACKKEIEYKELMLILFCSERGDKKWK